MKDRIKNTLLGISLVAALALGGSAIAGAASGDDDSSSSNGQAAQQGLPPQRADEELLTGDTAAKVREAALAEVEGATIERVETDADGHAKYEAHILKSDGSRATVYVNEDFEVVSVESSMR